MSAIQKYFLLLMLFFSILIIVVFTSIFSTYPELLPENKGEYSLFIMWGEEARLEEDGMRKWPQAFNNSKITTMNISCDLEYTNTKYPKLGIEKNPVFIIFDYKGIVLKTHNIQEATKFIKENLPG
ncbi:hypothetical protein [Paenisporosarcina antarctica]|uniref:Thioredoxin domain-containing protein n=1 Tax=Paenisporosarcina antarctica TaxID=417367 RepID=A0A4P7A1M5_9BACL|nr:hypothetical protein [Paenisporosarcina antarctica]QBP42821.1 hypothetical protein E2636_17480 [Paenisporosarcina antarctica]